MSQPENETPGTGAAHTVPPPLEQPAAEEPARLGPLSRLTGTLFSPGETFADVDRKPTWIAPMLIGMVTVLASTLFFQWRVNPDWDRIIGTQIRKQAEKSGQSLSEEEIQQRAAIGKTFAKLSPVIALVATPIFYVILAGIFALGLILIQAKSTFKKILSVVCWSSAATGIVTTIVYAAALMLRDPEELRSLDLSQHGSVVPTNVGAFLSSDTSAILRAIAGSLDVFTIWWLILLSIGFAAIAGSRKITPGKTGTMVFGLWAIWILVKVGWAAIFGG